MRLYVAAGNCALAVALRDAKVRALASSQAIDALILADDVVDEVDSQAELEHIPYWQQADKTMYEEQQVACRMNLRRDRRVRNALEPWWQTALRSLQSGGDMETCTPSGIER